MTKQEAIAELGGFMFKLTRDSDKVVTNSELIHVIHLVLTALTEESK